MSADRLRRSGAVRRPIHANFVRCRESRYFIASFAYWSVTTAE
jgi:hypothetical protein